MKVSSEKRKSVCFLRKSGILYCRSQIRRSMMKHSFFNRQEAAVTMLCSPESIGEAAGLARAAEMDGADGIAIELQKMPPEERTEQNFRSLINSAQLPFMFIDYRSDLFLGADDEARQKFLLLAAKCGAEVIDVMGDLYDPAPFELTMDPKAVKKQKALIARIHKLGAKVIMSSHMTSTERSAEEVLAHLREQSSRGADILKIVVGMNTEKALIEGVRTLLLLHRELDKPFVFLGGGKYGRFIRYIGPQLGAAIEFAVHDYPANQSYNQPTIRSFKGVMDNFHWDIGDLK